MFNLSQHAGISDTDLLAKEIAIYEIVPETNGYKLGLGDECVHLKSLDECLKHISQGVEEIRDELWEEWKKLASICEDILNEDGKNIGTLDNLVFLNSVKNAFIFSRRFADLKEFSQLLRYLLDIDISDIHNELVAQFNKCYLKIKLMHRLITSERYRSVLIKRYQTVMKTAQISGPWANLDLPMQERMWDYEASDAELFENRRKARREQTRYNPENTKDGYFYIWQDLTRDPYRYEEMSGINSNSPYKSRHLIAIP